MSTYRKIHTSLLARLQTLRAAWGSPMFWEQWSMQESGNLTNEYGGLMYA
jgi:hypothetical protein